MHAMKIAKGVLLIIMLALLNACTNHPRDTQDGPMNDSIVPFDSSMYHQHP